MRRPAMLVLIVLGLAGVAVLAAFIRPQPEPVPEDRGAPLADVSVPALSAVAMEGKAVFNQYCASCHGANAAGQEGIAPPLVHRIYEPGHHGDQAFLLAALRGVRAHHWPFGDMPPVGGVTQDEVAQIVTYVRELQRANGID